jgi:hypothetical protein
MHRVLSCAFLAASLGGGWAAGFQAPAGGWDYQYTGDLALGVTRPPSSGGPALDGTWSNTNPTDDWNGLPSGGVFSSGGVLTLDDSVASNPGVAGSNERFNFTHALTVPNTFLDDGVTLNFRARLSPSSVLHSGPDGYGIFSGGKGTFGIRQAGRTALEASLISFSLVNEVEDIGNDEVTAFFDADGNPIKGLTMNGRNGTTSSFDINSDTPEAVQNVLALDPAQFHDFWLVIKKSDGSVDHGTHEVDIFLDGNTTGQTFYVTAGTGDEGAGYDNYLALGAPSTGATGSVDIDSFAYKNGAIIPVPEPATMSWIGLGLVAGVLRKRR